MYPFPYLYLLCFSIRVFLSYPYLCCRSLSVFPFCISLSNNRAASFHMRKIFHARFTTRYFLSDLPIEIFHIRFAARDFLSDLPIDIFSIRFAARDFLYQICPTKFAPRDFLYASQGLLYEGSSSSYSLLPLRNLFSGSLSEFSKVTEIQFLVFTCFALTHCLTT